MIPRIRLSGYFSPVACHNPDVPFLGINGTRRQAESVIAGIVLKSSFIGEFLTENGVLLRSVARLNTADLSLIFGILIGIKPVNHLHKMVAPFFTGL